MDISVSCRIFWLVGGDAWREVADGMESTPVVRGSGGMCSKLIQHLCSKLDSKRHFLVKSNYDIMQPFLNSGGGYCYGKKVFIYVCLFHTPVHNPIHHSMSMSSPVIT